VSAVIAQDLLRYRPLAEEDVPVIMAIEESAYPFPWSETIFRDCLRAGYCSWVLERDHTIIAYGIMSIDVGECHLLNLCVRPEDQGAGLGRLMLDYLMDTARSHRAEIVFLEVRPSNEAARQLYFNAGFDQVGTRRNYYPAAPGREDAIIMARTLV